MSRHRWLTLGMVAAAVAGVFAGCGEKITVPVAEGLYGNYDYVIETTAIDPQARQLLSVRGNLFVLTAEAVKKYARNDSVTASFAGFTDAQAFCADDADSLVFVWDAGQRRVAWYSTQDLVPRAFADLPDVATAVAIATCRAGIEQVPGASTFLYLADPDSGVVHRYAFHPEAGLLPYGILCRAGGQGARFVHIPGAMARDSEDSLLVCDRDPERNWVIRFVSVPDPADISADPNLDDPLRGRAGLFHAPTCNPPAAADYVLGNAPGCDPLGWVPGPSTEEGEFDDPSSVTVDGLGKIYVTDRGNHRLQRFDSAGVFDFALGAPGDIPSPTGIAVLDGFENGVIVPGAEIYVISTTGVKRYRYKGTS